MLTTISWKSTEHIWVIKYTSHIWFHQNSSDELFVLSSIPFIYFNDGNTFMFSVNFKIIIIIEEQGWKTLSSNNLGSAYKIWNGCSCLGYERTAHHINRWLTIAAVQPRCLDRVSLSALSIYRPAESRNNINEECLLYECSVLISFWTSHFHGIK